jgi:hypothetical protein
MQSPIDLHAMDLSSGALFPRFGRPDPARQINHADQVARPQNILFSYVDSVVRARQASII